MRRLAMVAVLAGAPMQAQPPSGDALLAPARLAALPPAERGEWQAWIDTSRALAARDRAAMRRELDAAGLRAPGRAPYHMGFTIERWMTPAFARSDSGRRLTASVLSWQTPSGGWSKRIDLYAGPRTPGTAYGSEGDGWAYVPTIDNEATVAQLRWLGVVAGAGLADPAVRVAIARGVAYLERAQAPNGCWPQVYPLAGGYHDAATFNDDAGVNVLRLLRDVASGRLPGAPDDTRALARAAERRGVGCLVRAQVREGGVPTVWGQQHDPLTLAPVGARSYEHASLASKESATIVDFLMELPAPSPEVVVAVHAAADWFRRTALRDSVYEYGVGTRHRPGAPLLWPRMIELGTGRALFSNRDGVRRYAHDALTDRRQGYAWYSDQPDATLRRYERWARAHPRVAAR